MVAPFAPARSRGPGLEPVEARQRHVAGGHDVGDEELVVAAASPAQVSAFSFSALPTTKETSSMAA